VLILASASQSRKNLLLNSGINFIQKSSNFDESSIQIDNINELALELSISKAKGVFNNIIESQPSEIFLKYDSLEILGCDSIFEFNCKAYGKPIDKKEAYERWVEMSGRFGYLHTGHALFFCGLSSDKSNIVITKKITKVISSKIFFSKLLKKEIEKYVDSLEPLNCAGGFALEGRGGKYIERIDGCFSNVMGLSLPWLRKQLINQDIYA